MLQENAVSFIGFAGTGRRIEGAWAVYPNSTLFKVGNYPDKRFTMTAADMDRAVTMFDPSTLRRGNIEHTAFLSGRAARIQHVWREGDLLKGEVGIPLALDDLMIDDERRLSCEFDPRTKLIAGIALTTDPRVPEAVLMSAFANFTRYDTDQGQYSVQSLHDHACRHGAVCDKKNVDMSSRHESAAIQQVHDTCVEHGAKCAPTAGTRPAQFAGDGGKGNNMPTLKERINAWFTGAGTSLDEEADDAKFTAAVTKLAGGVIGTPADPQGTTVKPAAEARPNAVGGAQPANAALALFTGAASAGSSGHAQESEDVRLMREEIQKFQTERRLTGAHEFAKRIVAMSRALPREELGIAAAYFQAASDDAAHPAVVVFANTRGEDARGTRVDQLEALYMLRPPHNLTQETMAGIVATAAGEAPAAVALFNRQRTAEPTTGGEGASGHTKEKLLAMSEVGQQVLNGKGGK